MGKKSKEKKKKKEKEEKEKLKFLFDERTSVKNANLYITGWKPSFSKDRYNRRRARPLPQVHEPPIPISVGVLPTGAAKFYGGKIHSDGTRGDGPDGKDGKKSKGDGDDDDEEDLSKDKGLQERKKKCDKFLPLDEAEAYGKQRKNNETQRWDWKKCFFEACCGCCKKPKNAEWPDDEVILLTSTTSSVSDEPTTPEQSTDPSLSSATSSDDSVTGLIGDEADFPAEDEDAMLRAYLEKLGQGDLEGIRDPKCSEKRTCIIDTHQLEAISELEYVQLGKDPCTCPTALRRKCLETWKDYRKLLGLCDMKKCTRKQIKKLLGPLADEVCYESCALAEYRAAHPRAAEDGEDEHGGRPSRLRPEDFQSVVAEAAAAAAAAAAEAAKGPKGSKPSRISKASIIAEVPRDVPKATRRECKRAEIPGGKCPCSSSSLSSSDVDSEFSDESDFEAWNARTSRVSGFASTVSSRRSSKAQPPPSRAEQAIAARRALREMGGRGLWKPCCPRGGGSHQRARPLTEALIKEVLKGPVDPTRAVCTCSVRPRPGPCVCPTSPPDKN